MKMKKLLILAIVLTALLSVWQVNPASACEPPLCGTGTPGYWKNHPEAWPVDEIKIGDVTYSKDLAIWWMNQPVKGDKTITMFKAVVAAKLNWHLGNEAGCIIPTGLAAEAWMDDNPVGSGVKAKSDEWQYSHGEALYEMLDAYNNGELCAASRDALECS